MGDYQEIDPAVHEAIITGDQARELVDNPAFQKIMFALESEKDAAVKAMFDPKLASEDVKEIRRLRNIVWRHDEFVARLSALIGVGDIARQELE